MFYNKLNKLTILYEAKRQHSDGEPWMSIFHVETGEHSEKDVFLDEG
jgi:hypothetical protein